MHDRANKVEKTAFYNLQVNLLDERTLVAQIRAQLKTRNKISINFLNAHCFNIAQRNANYKAALDDTTFLLNDGVGIELAGRMVGVDFTENLNGTDLIPKLLDEFADREMSVFLFGAKPEVIEKAAHEFCNRNSRLRIADFRDGYAKDSGAVIDQINTSGAEVLVLGLGVPLQELWVQQYAAQLPNIKVSIAGGAIFDFVSGNAVRAPLWIRRAKLEWLFRFVQEPARLFGRYVFGPFVFFYHILKLRKQTPHKN